MTGFGIASVTMPLLGRYIDKQLVLVYLLQLRLLLFQDDVNRLDFSIPIFIQQRVIK